MQTYLNPVYLHECADPFVLKYKGEYWCYRTGGYADGRIFGILRSPDLVHWDAVGSAMDPLSPNMDHYWAPEVFYTNGRFYLYYAAGLGLDFHLRVAVATQPQGPFVDSGRRLTDDPFAIDAHVFEDDDGQRYLFYAVDFLDPPRAGTGTVVDRLLDPMTLAGTPRPVSRARYDWQIFDPQRAEKGGVCWHTVEGSFTLKHKGRYYQMFSGGNYQNPSYGVGYAVTPAIKRRGEWDQPIDGVIRFPILRTIPGRVNGPGHNSVVRGPDNRQNYCIYHVIKPQERFERILAIDPLEWVGERLTVLGPSDTPQPAPILPRICRLDEPAGAVNILGKGEFLLTALPGAPASARIGAAGPTFLLETSLRFLSPGESSLTLLSASQEALRFTIDGAKNRAGLAIPGRSAARWQPLPPGFDPTAVHLLRLEADFNLCRLSLDASAFRWEGELPILVDTAVYSVRQGALELAAIQLTRGFENGFEHTADLIRTGWQASPPAGAQLRDGILSLRPTRGETVVLSKPLEFISAELVVNLALLPAARCAFVLVASDGMICRLMLTANGLEWQSGAEESQSLETAAFVPGEFEQLRLRKTGAELLIMRGADMLASQPVSPAPFAFQIEAFAPGIDLDLVRLTEIIL